MNLRRSILQPRRPAETTGVPRSPSAPAARRFRIGRRCKTPEVAKWSCGILTKCSPFNQHTMMPTYRRTPFTVNCLTEFLYPRRIRFRQIYSFIHVWPRLIEPKCLCKSKSFVSCARPSWATLAYNDVRSVAGITWGYEERTKQLTRKWRSKVNKQQIKIISAGTPKKILRCIMLSDWPKTGFVGGDTEISGGGGSGRGEKWWEVESDLGWKVVGSGYKTLFSHIVSQIVWFDQISKSLISYIANVVQFSSNGIKLGFQKTRGCPTPIQTLWRVLLWQHQQAVSSLSYLRININGIILITSVRDSTKLGKINLPVAKLNKNISGK